MRKNLLAVLALQISFAVAQFIQVPLFLSFWGARQYGVWLVFQVVQLFAARSDFGLAIAVSKEITIRAERGDLLGAQSIYATTFTVVLAFQFLELLSICIGAWLFGGLLSEVGVSFSDLIWTAIFMALSGFAMTQMETLHAAFYASGLYWIGTTIRAVAPVAWISSVAVALVLGADLPETAAALFIGWLVPVITAVALLHVTGAPFRPYVRLRWSELQPLIAPALAVASLPLAQIISLSAPRAIIGAIVGPAGLAIFNAHRQLTRVIALIFGLSLAIEPAMTMAAGRGDREKYLAYALDCQLVIGIPTVIGIVVLAIMAPLVFKIWTSGTMELSWVLFIPLVLCAALEALWRAVITSLTAVNRHIIVGFLYVLANAAGFAAFSVLAFTMHTGTTAMSWCLTIIEMLMLIVVGRGFLTYFALSPGEWGRGISAQAEHWVLRAGQSISQKGR